MAFSDQNTEVFIKEIKRKNVVWKMAAILTEPQCIKLYLRSEWSTILLPTKVQLILDVWGYMYIFFFVLYRMYNASLLSMKIFDWSYSFSDIHC